MKKVIFTLLLLVSYNLFSQSTVNQIVRNYNSQVPINFGELSLTSVKYNEKFFSYNYQYENLKRDWSSDAKLGAISLQSSEISKSINTLAEFNTIKRSGRHILFIYADRVGESIYVIVFSLNNGKYEFDFDQSARVSKLEFNSIP